MALITANGLAKSYGPHDIFSGVSLEVPHGAKVALVGPNGAGKTTLLRLLADREEPSAGTVTRAKNLRIGYLPQESEGALSPDGTLWGEALSAFSELLAKESRLQDLEAQLATNSDDETLAAYGKLQADFEHAGGYTYELTIRQVLLGLGFGDDDFHRPIGQFSGGQKTRALLARLLLENPDLLILDEPTNHLDIKALEWLEKWLRNWDGAVLMVSHDRYFMDQVVTVVLEMVFGKLERYRGNFSHYVQQRDERHEHLLAEYRAQQEYIEKTEDYIRRNIAGQNTRQAQGRRKRLERFKRDEAINAPRESKIMKLDLQTQLRSGDKVLMTQGLQVGYHDDGIPLFDVPDITLYRGECAALIGPNGAGKTTFLKTILGQLPPLSGESAFGGSVQVGYFAQVHHALDPQRSVLDELLETQNMPISEARNLLARYLFTGDDVFKPILALSGGERARIALIKLSLSGANVLLLDEPTNHLDIPSQEILENTLAEFAGTILLVSHDRYLITNLATQIWALDDGRMIVHEGPYKEYLSALNTADEAQRPAAPAQQSPAATQSRAPRSGLTPYQRQQRIGDLEAAIHALEEQLETLNADIASASAASDVARVAELGRQHEAAQTELDATLAEWEMLHQEEAT